MALKTRGKLVALGVATFAAAAGLVFGTVASASGGTDQPVVRITQDQQGAGFQQTQQSQQTPRAPGGDARDCPFGHGSSNQSGTPNSGTPNSGTPSPGNL